MVTAKIGYIEYKEWPLAGEFVEFDTFVDIRQTILLGLARLAKGKFGDFYTNLANLVSVD